MSEESLKQTAFSFSARVEMHRQDFMVSECNKEAFSYIDMWPDWVSSGLLIYGAKGSGKTHLAHLFADKVEALGAKSFKVPFYDCSQINMKNVERICETSNAVILENLTENVNQEALFHLFNHFNNPDKYMLWTAETPPSGLNLRLEDLKSRLNMLPCIEIKQPDDMMLRALTVKLFDDRQLIVSPEIVEYIINNSQRSFAYLQMLIKEIDEISLAYKTAVNYKVVKEAMENLNRAEEREPDLFNNI